MSAKNVTASTPIKTGVVQKTLLLTVSEARECDLNVANANLCTVAFHAPDNQEAAWLAVVIFEYRNVESLGAQISGESGFTQVS